MKISLKDIQKRISLGMTQKELAAKLGIKEQMVQRYEASGYESILKMRGYANEPTSPN
jgi:ribosome-binding protein aMBF1 (putative translation factor)